MRPTPTAAPFSAPSRSCPVGSRCGAGLDGEGGGRRRAGRRRTSACSRPETTAGPFYLDPRPGAGATSPRVGPASPLRPHAAGRRRRLPAARGRAGRRLALRCRRQLLGLRQPGQRPGANTAARPSCAAPSSPTRAASRLRDDLAGLVPRPHPARPLQGLPRRRAPSLTSQLFFPDGASEPVYRGAAPTAGARRPRTPTNASDGIARRAGPRAFARVTEDAGVWQAALVVGVAAA